MAHHNRCNNRQLGYGHLPGHVARVAPVQQALGAGTVDLAVQLASTAIQFAADRSEMQQISQNTQEAHTGMTMSAGPVQVICLMG